MAGKPKHAEKLASHLGAPVDAACMIARAGSTATIAATGVAGMAASAARRRLRGEDDGEITVPGNGWLAVGPEAFTLVPGDKLLGNPKGAPSAEIAYTDVSAVAVKDGVITTRADVALADGRSFAFETRRKGANKANPEVLALLAQRCAAGS